MLFIYICANSVNMQNSNLKGVLKMVEYLKNQKLLTYEEMNKLYRNDEVYCIYNYDKDMYIPVIVITNMKNEEFEEVLKEYKNKDTTIFQGINYALSHRVTPIL